MEVISKQTGLSSYFIELVCDSEFGSSTGAFELYDIVAPRKTLFAFTKAELAKQPQKHSSPSSKRKAIVKHRADQLDKLCQTNHLTVRERDYILLDEFVGWARTKNNHFIYVYYTGGEMRRLENWIPVDKGHLPLFYKRIGKDISGFLQYSRLDLRETADGHRNLELDMRYILERWKNSAASTPSLTLIRTNLDQIAPRPDYLVEQQRKEAKKFARETTPVIEKDTEFERLLEAGLDPYEVHDEEWRHMTEKEYTDITEFPLKAGMQFDFGRYVEVSRRAFPQNAPPTFYEFDPGELLFTPLAISLHLEAHARRSVSILCHEELHIVANRNVTKVLDDILKNPASVAKIQERGEEFLWANMAVENASRHLPENVSEKLGEAIK